MVLSNPVDDSETRMIKNTVRQRLQRMKGPPPKGIVKKVEGDKVRYHTADGDHEVDKFQKTRCIEIVEADVEKASRQEQINYLIQTRRKRKISAKEVLEIDP